jgi:hypothetical protein
MQTWNDGCAIPDFLERRDILVNFYPHEKKILVRPNVMLKICNDMHLIPNFRIFDSQYTGIKMISFELKVGEWVVWSCSKMENEFLNSLDPAVKSLCKISQ